MKTPTPIKLDIHFPIDKPTPSGYVFTKEAVENALQQINGVPLVEYGHEERLLGLADEGELNSETVTVSGKIFDKFPNGKQDFEYTYENGKLKIISFGIVPNNRG